MAASLACFLNRGAVPSLDASPLRPFPGARPGRGFRDGRIRRGDSGAPLYLLMGSFPEMGRGAKLTLGITAGRL